LREAASPYAAARIAIMSRPPGENKNEKATLGGPPEPAGDRKSKPDAKRGRDAQAPHDQAGRRHAPMPACQPYGN
jgi:hypothetical protein